ncbi:MAG: hypothetical protein QXH07_03640 [Thermoplasmata archaeon]
MRDDIKKAIDTIIDNINGNDKIKDMYDNLRNIGMDASNIAIISRSVVLLSPNIDIDKELDRITKTIEKILVYLNQEKYDLTQIIEILLITIGSIIDTNEELKETSEYIEQKLDGIDQNYV